MASIILVTLLIVGLYSVSTGIITVGGDNTQGTADENSKLFECVQQNPGKGVEWCRENTAGEVIPDEPVGI